MSKSFFDHALLRKSLGLLNDLSSADKLLIILDMLFVRFLIILEDG